MSAAETATKPTVEEPVAAPKPTETPLDTAAVTETKPTTESTPAPTAETTEQPTEEVAPVVEAPKPVEEGVLGYKGPGLLKGLIFQKKHFWFGSDAVEQKNFASYLRGEKPESANHNVAWASHTGKGLLFFSKKATEKVTPAHVFNLSEVTDITEDGPTEFHFTQGGHKHIFQASSLNERDSWVATLKTKVEEAKTLGETVKDTEEYKNTHSSLTKPTVVASASAPKKSTEVKDKLETAKEEKKEEHEAKKEEKAEEKKEIKEEKKEEKKERTKSRSASRKRASIFGSIGFGKKEEKTEVKPEKKEETAPAATSETPAVAAEPEQVPAPVETAPIVTEPSAAPGASTTEPAVAAEPRPAASKRNSIFDSFKSFGQKKPTEEKKAEEKKAEEKKVEEAPVVDTKETEPVSKDAPVIPAVETQEPLSTSVVTPATAPTEETTVTSGEPKPVESAPAVKSDKRKASIPWLSKKKEVTSSDEEGEKKPTSPFAKLRATVKGKSPKAEKPAEKEKEKTPEPVETAEPVVKKEETPVAATEEAKKDTPIAATPQVAATA